MNRARFFIAICSLLALASPTFGAITYDTTCVGAGTCSYDANTGATTSYSAVTNVSGCANGLLVIKLSSKWSSSAGTTTAAIGATSAVSVAGPQNWAASFQTAEVFVFKNPSAGAKTINFTWTNAVDYAFIQFDTYCGVDQTTPNGTGTSNANANNPATLSVASALNDWVTDFFATFGTAPLTAGGSQTERGNWQSGIAGAYVRSSDAPGTAGTTAISWSSLASDYWVYLGVALKPSGGSPPALARRRVIVVQ